MNITLTKTEPKYKDDLITLCNAVDRKYLANRLPFPYTEQDADFWLDLTAKAEGKTGLYRLIFVDGKIAGNISVEKKDDVYARDAEIGYMLLTEFWSKGIATAAVKEMCQLAFESLDIIRITGVCYAPNIASKRVMEKAGFAEEGLLRDAVTKNGAVYDLYVMGILRKEVLAE